MNDSNTHDKLPQNSKTYDEMFATGGHSGAFDLPYKRSLYYPMFKGVYREIRRKRMTDIQEVGCGTGGLAHLLLDQMSVNYTGFDLSKITINKAIQRTGSKELFYVADATIMNALATTPSPSSLNRRLIVFKEK